jgi:hypothetical protein
MTAASSKRQAGTTQAPKRRRQQTPTRQLAMGKPCPEISEMAWREIEPFANHIRHISDRMAELIRHHGRKTNPFLVVSMEPETVVAGGPVGVAMCALFSPASIKLAWEARDFYSGSDFHPYFDLFLREVSLREVGLRGLHSHIADEVTRRVDVGITDSQSDEIVFFDPQQARRYCDVQNASFLRICKGVQTDVFQKRIQSLSRAARDNRKSLMQFAGKALDAQPTLRITQFTLLGVRNAPDALDTLHKAREKLVRFLDQVMDPYGYLGYILFLRRDTEREYHFRGLILFRETHVSTLHAASSRILRQWERTIGVVFGDGGYGGPLPPHRTLGEPHALMLELSTLLTAPDFYVRLVATDGRRQFWKSLSPKPIKKPASASRRRAIGDGFDEHIKMWQEQFQMAREGYRQLTRAERKALNAPIPDEELPAKFWETKKIAAQAERARLQPMGNPQHTADSIPQSAEFASNPESDAIDSRPESVADGTRLLYKPVEIQPNAMMLRRR